MTIQDAALIGFIPATDLARAKQFYQDALGLEFVRDDGFALVFKTGSNMLRVVGVQDFAPQPFTICGWEVGDIATKVCSLKERGVTFERFDFFEQDELGVWTAPGGDKVAWFKDSEGNTLSLSEHVPQVA